MGNLEFRIWDKKAEKFCEGIEFHPLRILSLPPDIDFLKEHLGNRRFTPITTNSELSFLNIEENFEIDQFTGKTDIHGVKIFNNDIIRYIVNTEGKETVKIAKVEYDNGKCGFKPLCWHHVCDEDAWYSYEIFNIEVIADFHQHPETLKSKP